MLIISLLAIFAGRHAELVLESAGERPAGGQQHHSRHSVIIVFTHHVVSLLLFLSSAGGGAVRMGIKKAQVSYILSHGPCTAPYIVGDCAVAISSKDVWFLFADTVDTFGRQPYL